MCKRQNNCEVFRKGALELFLKLLRIHACLASLVYSWIIWAKDTVIGLMYKNCWPSVEGRDNRFQGVFSSLNILVTVTTLLHLWRPFWSLPNRTRDLPRRGQPVTLLGKQFHYNYAQSLQPLTHSPAQGLTGLSRWEAELWASNMRMPEVRVLGYLGSVLPFSYSHYHSGQELTNLPCQH